MRNIKLKISFIINIKQRRDEWFSFARCYPATHPGASQARFHILSLHRLWRCLPLPGEEYWKKLLIVICDYYHYHYCYSAMPTSSRWGWLSWYDDRQSLWSWWWLLPLPGEKYENADDSYLCFNSIISLLLFGDSYLFQVKILKIMIIVLEIMRGNYHHINIVILRTVFEIKSDNGCNLNVCNVCC